MEYTDVSASRHSHWTEAEALGATQPRTTAKRPARTGEDRQRQILTHAVELDVIPELLARHRVQEPAALIAHGYVTRLTSLVLSNDAPAALAFVMDVHAQGTPADSLLLDLLAPTARALGVMWEHDLCDFTEVTIGLWRLQSAMRALSPRETPATSYAPSIVLVPLPGEPHTFGLGMVYEFFRQAGWNAWTGPVESSAALRTLVGQRSISVLGFSLACDERIDDVRREIAAVRRASKNPAIAVMVGGPCFTADPTLAASVGADATAADARDAVVQATALVERAAMAERNRT